MKKILGIILLAALLVVGVVGYRYWDSTYNGTTAYTYVTATPEKKPTVDSSGAKVSDNGQQLYSYDYSLTFVREDGSKVNLPFEISRINPTPLANNSYYIGKVSQKRVLEGPSPIAASKVPQKIKDALK